MELLFYVHYLLNLGFLFFVQNRYVGVCDQIENEMLSKKTEKMIKCLNDVETIQNMKKS